MNDGANTSGTRILHIFVIHSYIALDIILHDSMLLTHWSIRGHIRRTIANTLSIEQTFVLVTDYLFVPSNNIRLFSSSTFRLEIVSVSTTQLLQNVALMSNVSAVLSGLVGENATISAGGFLCDSMNRVAGFEISTPEEIVVI